MSGTEVVLKFLAILLAIYGLGLQWWGFFADRRQDRRRCPKCWYDMSGSTGRRCPECGRTAKREVDLLQRRPRYKALALGILMMLSAVFLFVVAEQGYQRMIPDRVLVWMVPSFAGSDGTLEREFERRLRSDELTNEQWARAVRRVLADQDPIWSVELATRDKWPRDVPLEVAVRAVRNGTGVSWIDDAAMRMSLTPPYGNTREPIVLETSRLSMLYGESMRPVHRELFTEDFRNAVVELPHPELNWRHFTNVTSVPLNDAGERSFEIKVELARMDPRSAAQGRGSRRAPSPNPTDFVQADSGNATLELTVVDSHSDILTKVPIPADVTALEYFGLHVSAGIRFGSSTLLERPLPLVRSTPDNVELMDDVIVPIAIELRLDGQTVAKGEIVWIESVTLRRMGIRLPLVWDAAPVDFNEVPTAERDRWSAHGRVDPNLALKFFDHDRYLDIEGEFEIPIEWGR